MSTGKRSIDPGGYLEITVKTMFPEENDDTIYKYLMAYGEWAIIELNRLLYAEGTPLESLVFGNA